MATACRRYPGAHFLFYRNEPNNAGGIFGNQRAGLPQYTFYTDIRKRRQTLSEVRGNILPYCGWRQGKCLLPCLPKGLIMLNAEEIYQILFAAYGKLRWWSDEPFIIMFQSVLVQNTAWSSVEKTCIPMQDKLTPEYIGNNWSSLSALVDFIRQKPGQYRHLLHGIATITLTAGKYKAPLCRIYGKSFYLSEELGTKRQT